MNNCTMCKKPTDGMYRGAPACSFPEECMYKMMRTEMEEEREVSSDEIHEAEEIRDEYHRQQAESSLFGDNG